jgi:hypothetical protein
MTLSRLIAPFGTGMAYELAGQAGDERGLNSLISLNSQPQYPTDPPEEVFHGLAGEIVRTLEPHTEADPVALLGQFLAAFGNVAGPGPFFRVEADRHGPKINVVLVGRTSRGRKGTSFGRVMQIVSGGDSDWAEGHVAEGLSSGEGLIWAVRDPIEKLEPVREKGKVTGYQSVIEDEGVEDKRLLVVQSEFASTLRTLQRDGNTLSATLRQAFDTGDLRVMTKNSPARATASHISIIGHITKEELLRYLDRTEMANGLANRFIWLCVKRSKLLPEGGSLREADLADLREKVKEAIRFAKDAGEMVRDDDARAMWARVYPELSAERSAMFGAITSRAEAQVTRLSCIYALLDRSAVIRGEHLTAALALWSYAEASARFIFGDATGDPTADDLISALKERHEGLTRTEISNLFKKHKDAGELRRALTALQAGGIVRCVSERTAGRSVDRFTLV